MGLRDKLKNTRQSSNYKDIQSLRFKTYGIVDNPFPSSAQTQNHPHMETAADNIIVEQYVRPYDENQSTQVLVIEGDQGTGKTNLLNYYDREFNDLYQDTDGFYIIRYYSDPEPGFDKVVTHIFQELGVEFIKEIAEALVKRDEESRNQVISMAQSPDIRTILHALTKAVYNNLDEVAAAALDWLLGHRLLKRHKQLGSIQFRLNTIESKTKALRDIVFCSAELNVLKGLILLLDELEKQDITTSKLMILRYLESIRALIDALPKYLFLMAAITPEARRRYFEMVPAFAGRLQNRIELPYLTDQQVVLELYSFYLEQAKENVPSKYEQTEPNHIKPIISEDEVRDIFDDLLQKAHERGDEGIRHRDFLNELHNRAEKRLSDLAKK